MSIVTDNSAVIAGLNNRIELLEKALKSTEDIASNLNVRIAELEKELSIVIAGLFSEDDLAIRDLEQQAKGAVNGYVSGCKWALGAQYNEEVVKNRAIIYSKALKETK